MKFLWVFVAGYGFFVAGTVVTLIAGKESTLFPLVLGICMSLFGIRREIKRLANN